MRDVLIAMVVLASMLSSSSTLAQDRCNCNTSDRTSLAGDARYEVVTLSDSGDAFRLDKITGEVSRLQRSGSRFTAMTLEWKALPMPPGEEGATTTARVNYQLVLVERANFPLLLNVHTGATWTLRSAAGDVKWEAIAIEK